MKVKNFSHFNCVPRQHVARELWVGHDGDVCGQFQAPALLQPGWNILYTFGVEVGGARLVQ